MLSGAAAVAAPTIRARPDAGAVDRRCAPELPDSKWGVGPEGQRKADLGNGTFLNPIVSGDHPDPSVVKEGGDYFLTFSSFDAYPGLVIWHSQDLVNWEPLVAALNKPIGSVWAPELVKHDERYQIFFHARTPGYRSIYVITARDIRGPWSEPVDLGLHRHIDPGHVVGEDGRRYLFLSNGDRARLADDGLSIVGELEHVYDPWTYPDDWVVETFAPEGPKLVRRGEWFYMITAVGGTAGPPTGHMVVAARSRSVHGPWQNAPGNPLVRTRSASEKWWSRGHATPVEAPDGSWWLVYHGYENGYWTLGRQALLDPMEWTADGWIAARGGDLSQALRKPANGSAVAHGLALSDDFSVDRFGIQWAFYDPSPNEMQRVRYEGGALVMKGKGAEPRDCSPLTFCAGDQAYEVEVEMEVRGDARAGLLLFYSRRLYCGLCVGARSLVMHRYGTEREQPKPPGLGKHVFLRIANDRHIVSIDHSPDGKRWTPFGVRMEVSGYHHNVAGDFLSLRPAIYVSGAGEASFRNLSYRAR